MSTLELEEGDTGEAILNAKDVHADRDGSERPRVQLPAPPEHRVHNHDLDPTCRETRNQFGRLVGECLKAPRPETPSTEVARDRDAETRLSRLERMRAMTDLERRFMLAWIIGYAPQVFDEAYVRPTL